MVTSVVRVLSVLKFGALTSLFQMGCSSSFFESDHTEAQLVLGELGFDQAGGPLLFNHPKGIATDGDVLMLADGNNHRLGMFETPTDNTPPICYWAKRF